MNILTIQHSPLDPAGALGEQLVSCGAQLFTWLPQQQPVPTAADYSALVIMGGLMGAYEEDKFPHLQQTIELIHQFHAENKPIMGICLGAQLIARAFGSHVYPHRTPELGYSPVKVIDPMAQEPWLRDCPENLYVMQWHFDTFDLPSQATLLMTNDVCKNQAYRIGSNIYGFQFHLEATPEIISGWKTMKDPWIEANYPHLEQQLEVQVQIYAPQSIQFAQKVARAWANYIPSQMALPS